MLPEITVGFTIGISCMSLNASSSGQGPVAGSYEHGNEPSGSIKGREFLHYLGDN
jgi:hypothetical protein